MSSAGIFFLVTAYSLGCDAHGPFTKAGTRPVAEFTIAADPVVVPIGSIVHIEGLGERMVHDIGGKVKGRHIDIYVSTCHEARDWGRQRLSVRILHTPKVRQRRLVEPVQVTDAE